jgi:hypothetical protein
MDDTLIKTKSGKTFATSRQDWQWFVVSNFLGLKFVYKKVNRMTCALFCFFVRWDDKVPTKLKALHAQGYKLMIFTNQVIGLVLGRFCALILVFLYNRVVFMEKVAMIRVKQTRFVVKSKTLLASWDCQCRFVKNFLIDFL